VTSILVTFEQRYVMDKKKYIPYFHDRPDELAENNSPVI
jgi:hypothetical protein